MTQFSSCFVSRSAQMDSVRRFKGSPCASAPELRSHIVNVMDTVLPVSIFVMLSLTIRLQISIISIIITSIISIIILSHRIPEPILKDLWTCSP